MSPKEIRRRDRHRSALRGVGTVGVLLTCYALVPLRGDLWWLGAAIGTAVLLAIAPVTVSLLHRVLRSERPAFEALEAVVQLLTMLIVSFASIYYAMNRDGEHFDGLGTRVDAAYFAVATVSTVGFGDVVPVSQAARLLVTAHILFDLVFIGLAVRIFARIASR